MTDDETEEIAENAKCDTLPRMMRFSHHSGASPILHTFVPLPDAVVGAAAMLQPRRAEELGAGADTYYINPEGRGLFYEKVIAGGGDDRCRICGEHPFWTAARIFAVLQKYKETLMPFKLLFALFFPLLLTGCYLGPIATAVTVYSYVGAHEYGGSGAIYYFRAHDFELIDEYGMGVENVRARLREIEKQYGREREEKEEFQDAVKELWENAQKEATVNYIKTHELIPAECARGIVIVDVKTFRLWELRVQFICK